MSKWLKRGALRCAASRRVPIRIAKGVAGNMKIMMRHEELESAQTLPDLLRTLVGVFNRIDSAPVRLAAASSGKLRGDLAVFREYRSMFTESVEMAIRVKQQAEESYSDPLRLNRAFIDASKYELHAVEVLFLTAFMAGQITGQSKAATSSEHS